MGKPGRIICDAVAAMTLVLTIAAAAIAQTTPTQTEVEQWKTIRVLEASPCKEVTWILEKEDSVPLAEQRIHNALGWWGRGFIEGAVYMIGEKARQKADEFGLSVPVVVAHISTYCYAHQTETPFDAVQDLLLKVLN